MTKTAMLVSEVKYNELVVFGKIWDIINLSPPGFATFRPLYIKHFLVHDPPRIIRLSASLRLHIQYIKLTVTPSSTQIRVSSDAKKFAT